MTSIKETIIPKSDQLNADDLISGPIQIRITGVKVGSGDQPVSISYENDNGKPYKPCKSMRRVLVRVWGDQERLYLSRHLRLYCDPEVTFGKDKVGGIRISHMSDIDRSETMPLTVTRGKKKPFTVEPLEGVPPCVDHMPDLVREFEEKVQKIADEDAAGAKSFIEKEPTARNYCIAIKRIDYLLGL